METSQKLNEVETKDFRKYVPHVLLNNCNLNIIRFWHQFLVCFFYKMEKKYFIEFLKVFGTTRLNVNKIEIVVNILRIIFHKKTLVSISFSF